MHLVSRAGVELEVTGYRAHIGTSLRYGFAGVVGLYPCQSLGVRQHERGEGQHQPAAFGGREFAPGAAQGFARSLDSGVDLMGASAGQPGELAARCRGEHDQWRVLTGDPLIADQVAVQRQLVMAADGGGEKLGVLALHVQGSCAGDLRSSREWIARR